MITITVDNYEKQKFIYTMPDTAIIDMVSENVLNTNGDSIKTGLFIDVVCAAGIKLKKEEVGECENYR